MMANPSPIQERRVVVVHWKLDERNPFEVFSSLKNFCLSYPAYNYNTVTNYLSKAKTAYDTAEVRIERKRVFLKPKVALHQAADEKYDHAYWINQPPEQRLRAVTEIVFAAQRNPAKLDKKKITKVKLKG